MASSKASKDLVDELVHQFTDPYAAYRELIQNSIDAGSTRIDVTLAFRPTTEGGLMTSCVHDWGEGMNRRIIEDYFLTKFRSSKENDLTKIGKYGIGFVSVFALEPDAVTVDTGRDGESWRVLFKEDRSYELLALQEPVEGTRITLHTKTSAAAYSEHVAKARAALSRWCRHSEVDVTFAHGGTDGSAPTEPVSLHEPVVVDAPYQVEHKEEGLHVVVGPARELPAVSGFYNRGLTLLETQEKLLPRIALKVVSRTLEHTLTRDDVKRDESFSRAMGIAKKLVSGPLHHTLMSELEKAAERPKASEDWRTLFRYAADVLPKKSLWLRAPGGRAFAPKELGKALVVAPKPTQLVERLVAAGVPVVEADASEHFAEAVAKTFGLERVEMAELVYTYAEPTTAKQPEGFEAALVDFLQVARCTVKGVTLAELKGAASNEPHAFIEAVGRPIDIAPAMKPLQRGKAAPVLCLNTAHDDVEKARELMHRAPRLTALLWARRLLVRHGLLDAKTDAALTAGALA